MSEAPLNNTQDVRTESGELKDQSQTGETDETLLGGNEGGEEDGSKTLLDDGEKKEQAEGAPEKYEAFTVPEGYEIDAPTMEKAQGIFKELNLSQEQAQKLVNFYSDQVKALTEAPAQAFEQMNTEWATRTKADPEVGPHLDKVKETVSKALSSLGDEKLIQEFRDAMNVTGVGNNPAFVKLLYRMSQRLVEGGHVTGKGPTAPSQKEPNSGAVPIANALYPNLP